jgi:hypothetical protein
MEYRPSTDRRPTVLDSSPTPTDQVLPEAGACPLQALSGGKQSVHINGPTDCADCWETALVNGDVVEFARLAGADLVLDRVYRGGTAGGTGDDPLCKLLPVGNQGGFRPAGSPTRNSVKLAVLYTTGEEADWPDTLDPYTGTFTYYGDNRRPGSALEDTPNRGNLLLSRVFAWAHGDAAARAKVPPFLLFDKPGGGRDVRFRGLLAPGSNRLSGEEDLVAVWRTTSGVRFQNCQAQFTVLDTPLGHARLDRPARGRAVVGQSLPGSLASLGGTRHL